MTIYDFLDELDITNGLDSLTKEDLKESVLVETSDGIYKEIKEVFWLSHDSKTNGGIVLRIEE